MLQVLLRDVFQTGSLLLVIKMLSAVQRAPRELLYPYLPTALGSCSFLLPAVLPENSIGSAHGHLETQSCPAPGSTCLPAPCSALSALFNLPVAVGFYSSLKVRWPRQNFFLKQMREHSQGPFLWQSWSSGNQYKWSDRQLEWYSCLQSEFLCVYRYVDFVIWSLLLQKKNGSQSAGRRLTSVI